MTIKVNLFEAFRNARMRNPDASRKEAFRYFLTEVQRDPQYLVLMAEYYFDHQFKENEPVQIGDSTVLSATPEKLRRLEKAKVRRAETKDMVEKEVKRLNTVILMSLVLPNGKKLRDATGAECAKAGGFYTEVSRHLKGTQVVGKQLEESELRNILSRFDKKPQARTASYQPEMRV